MNLRIGQIQLHSQVIIGLGGGLLAWPLVFALAMGNGLNWIATALAALIFGLVGPWAIAAGFFGLVVPFYIGGFDASFNAHTMAVYLSFAALGFASRCVSNRLQRRGTRA